MAKKCIYCKTEVEDAAVMDVCDRCGVGVWGVKMFQAIKSSMESARESGDLYQGSVSNPQTPKQQTQHTVQKKSFTPAAPASGRSSALASMAQDAMRSKETEQNR